MLRSLTSSLLRSSRPFAQTLTAIPTVSTLTTKRFLNLHEYQSKELMEKYNIRVQRGKMAENAEDAQKAGEWLMSTGAKELVIKAQIHAGGRGKGHFPETGFKGGVHITTAPSKIKELAKSMLGHALVTKQTPPEGQMVKKVLVHESINFKQEFYFAVLMDRTYQGPVIVVSPRGGMDIEEVAEKEPAAIRMFPVDVFQGPKQSDLEKIADFLGLTANKKDACEQMRNLYNMFLHLDATQVEINPFVLTDQKLIYCVDAKITFDDNAEFRHKDVFALRDFSMEDPREVAAAKFNLNYVGLDGSIGCMVNGAGLAMATMDIIKLHGGSPANFLDVGGGANEKQVEEAFKILTSDKNVKGLLVNIFGGIMKCDVIAQGIINAARNISLKVPLVVRLEGTNVKKGLDLLNNSGLPIITASDLDDAAEKAVKSIQKK